MNNSFYNDFAAHFAASTLTSLVRSFNSQVGKRGFNSVRAAHDQALIDELVRRGIDVSAVFEAQWKFSGDKHKSLQVDTERTFHQRCPLVML